MQTVEIEHSNEWPNGGARIPLASRLRPAEADGDATTVLRVRRRRPFCSRAALLGHPMSRLPTTCLCRVSAAY